MSAPAARPEAVLPGDPGPVPVPPRRTTVLVSGVASDAHTWNLVFLQLLLEELGFDVFNLGPCVPDEELIDTCRRLRPAALVLGTVNGHGYQDGARLIGRLRTRAGLTRLPVIIGGKLGIAGGDDDRERVRALMAAGFDAVFADGGSGVADFRTFVSALLPAAGVPVSA